MDIASADRRGPTNAVGDDLLVNVNGARVLRRAVDGAFIIGRDVPPSHIRIDHPGISRLHVRLLPGARWELVDYDSRNGVYLDGHRIEYEMPITDGMTVHLGAYDGIPVTFLYVPAEQQHTPTDEVFDPDVQRTGHAVADRLEELGLSARELGKDAGIDTAIVDGLIAGLSWPDAAARGAIETALAWPTAALEEVRRGEPDGEITEVITPAMRRALLIDAAALTLANVDRAIADLPPAADPRFTTKAERLLNLLAALENSLGTTPALEDGGGAEMLRTVTRVYTSILTLAGAAR
ncbi:FHA domain-containing protein [Mycobacterium sp. AZCC_0083]|uniref:FHA domain-containing protein n=1 Tax=Mycobacterium sp. AZCC_0083 TaxID=2735882 RepID=UPI00161853E0|nr:FHA domain-containing protein [Mycobacterium sp. AZCC_0083]MBB5163553.1 pSer/pThr/pTyr-binding forkhead associated (FHA) protein [Mycobacterium sp. AZCC_0083]